MGGGVNCRKSLLLLEGAGQWRPPGDTLASGTGHCKTWKLSVPANVENTLVALILSWCLQPPSGRREGGKFGVNKPRLFYFRWTFLK